MNERSIMKAKLYQRLTFTLTLGLLFAAQPLRAPAQMTTTGSGNIIAGTSGSLTFNEHTATTLTSATAWSWCNFNTGVCSSGDLREMNGYLETRKDDGHGPTILQVKANRRRLAPSDLAPAGYVKLAKSVGLETPAEEAEVLEAISDAGLGVYSFAKVDDYLYRQALKLGARYRWVWKPVGAEAATQIGFTRKEDHAGVVMATAYQRDVPVRVLQEIAKLKGCLAEAIFLVSDYEVVKPDPFLAITTKALLDQGKIWIVDQWDEPGFTEKAEPVAVPVPATPRTDLVASR